MGKEEELLVVCADDCKIDNPTFKSEFGIKAKMSKAEEVESYTNHEVGGVCLFAIPKTTNIYLDVSLQRFDYEYPACGSSNTAIKLTMDELEILMSFVKWVYVCKGYK